MIRGSTAIAIAAIVLSLLVHSFGLSFTSRSPTEPTAEDAATDVVTLGSAFEDVAEAPSEPVPPEPAPVPEPPVSTLPEPERADTPTSEALVASPDPQRVDSPDTGSATDVQPDTIRPSEPEMAETSAPETLEPSDGAERTTTDVAVTPPVEPDTIAEAPKGNPDARDEPAQAAAVNPVLSPPVAPAPQPGVPQRLAALPVPVAPVLPVTPSPAPSSIPVISLEREVIDPEIPEIAVEPVPDDPEIAETEEVVGGSDLAVVASLRPRLPERRPSPAPSGLLDGSQSPNDLLLNPPQRIESPLKTYQRDGIDLFGATRSSGVESRGAGNSSATNYAGQVLVHLHRSPAVRVSAQGSVRVSFKINPDGSLAWVDIIGGTGSQEINRAAEKQVRNAVPFPRPPGGTSRELTFIYRSN